MLTDGGRRRYALLDHLNRLFALDSVLRCQLLLEAHNHILHKIVAYEVVSDVRVVGLEATLVLEARAARLLADTVLSPAPGHGALLLLLLLLLGI